MAKPKTPIGQTYSDDFRGRIRILAKKYKNREEAAKAFGAAKASLDAWIYGKNTPSFEAMIKLARSTGTSLDWLAFGGEETRHEGTEDRTKVGYDLMSELFNDLKDVYQAEGWLIMPESAYKVALDLYREVQTLETISERRAALKSHVRMHAKHGIRPPETESAQDQSSVG